MSINGSNGLPAFIGAMRNRTFSRSSSSRESLVTESVSSHARNGDVAVNILDINIFPQSQTQAHTNTQPSNSNNRNISPTPPPQNQSTTDNASQLYKMNIDYLLN